MLFATLSWLLSALGRLVAAALSPVTLALVATLATTLYLYASRNRNYWKDRGVAHLPYRFPFGSVGFEFFTTPFTDIMRVGYAKLHKADGFTPIFDFFGPSVTVTDPELIKAILVKDFDHFTTRVPDSVSKNFGILSKMMTSLSGQHWKDVRGITTPVFSTGKIRQMCGPCAGHAAVLAEQMEHESRARGEIDIKAVLGRYTMDVIASVAFGLEADSLRNPDSAIAGHAARITQRASTPRLIYMLILFSLPDWLQRRLDMQKVVVDNAAIQYFSGVTAEAIRRRRAQPKERRADFLQLLLDTRDEARGAQKRQLTDEEITAQCLLFYIAGYDTTSNTLTWAARLLAFHPAAQRRLQAEIDDKLPADAAITFEAVAGLEYLDRVLSETLRLYPPPILARCCTKPYRLPGTDIELPVNTTVGIPVYSLHHDPDIYPDPEAFDPDRFLPEARDARHPYLYLPFGHGPRNCIGSRFALLEAKVALMAVLRGHSFVPGPRSGRVEPEFGRDTDTLREKGGTWLRVVPREQA